MSDFGTTSAADGLPVRVGDIAKARMGKTILSKELTETGVPVYSAGRENEPWGYIPSSDLLFGKETIVIAARGNIGFPRVPRVAPFVSTQTTIAISLKDSRYVPYLRYQLETVNWSAMTSQTTIPMVTVRQVEGIEVKLPSLPEQQRVVAEIEKQFTRLEAGVAGLRRVQANLKRYRAAVLKAACEGKLVPTEAELARQEGRTYETGAQLLERVVSERRQKWNGKGKYKEPERPDTKNLSELPKGWTWATAEQICQFITKGTTPRAEKLHSGSGEVQFIKVYNLTFTGRLDHDYKPVFIDRKTHDGELARSKVSSGDILINIVGPPLGQVAVVPDDVSEANINQAIARFSPLDGVSNHFLSTAFQTQSVMSWAINRAKTTAGQANLTLELCRELPVPLPPFAEQRRIVAEVERRLSVVDELEAVVNASLQRGARLRQSILQDAFSGNLLLVGV